MSKEKRMSIFLSEADDQTQSRIEAQLDVSDFQGNPQASLHARPLPEHSSLRLDEYGHGCGLGRCTLYYNGRCVVHNRGKPCVAR